MQKNWKIKSFTSLKNKLNVNYYKDFIPENKADHYFKIFEKYMTYNNPEDTKITLPSGEFFIKRKQVSYGEPDIVYKFVGVNSKAVDWNTKDDPVCKIIRSIKRRVELFTGENFNYVLVNRYADGNDVIGFHRDKEDELDPSAPIVGVTFGAERDFAFKADAFIPSNMSDRFDLILHHGSVICMNYPTNQHWKHSVPKRAGVRGVRINLTFRRVRKNWL
jgi:DNA oxidative demethylase